MSQGRAISEEQKCRFLTERIEEASRRLHSSGTGAQLRQAERAADGPFRLTDVQQAYYVGRMADVDLGGMGCHSYSEFLFESLDVPRLEQALNALVRRHEMLRAVVVDSGWQRILENPPPVTIPALDYSNCTRERSEQQLESVRKQMSTQVFDVTQWPLFDFRVTKCPGGGYRLHVSIDVMMVDGSSLRLLMRELWCIYAGDQLAEPPSVRFRDYLHTLNELSEETARAAAEVYWRAWLRNRPPAPEVPRTAQPPTPPLFYRRRHRLTSDEWDGLRRRAVANGTPPVSLLIAIYAETLYRWSGTRRFCINLTSYDRRDICPDVDRIVGNFTSVVLLGIEAETATGLGKAATAVHRQLWEALEHRAMNGLEVLRLSTRTDANEGLGTPLVPFVFTSLLGTSSPVVDGTAPAHEEVFGVSQTPQVLIDCQVFETTDGGLQLQWDAVDGAFPPRLLDEMFEAFVQLVSQAVSVLSEKWCPELPAPTALHTTLTRSQLLHRAFLETARTDPDALAVIAEGIKLSYGELERRAQRLGARIASVCGQEKPVVAIFLPKGADQIVAVLGVLLAGAAFLPLPIRSPAKRLESMLEQSKAALIVTDAEGANRLVATKTPPCIDVGLALQAAPASVRASSAEPDDLAYVIFTSGSTGSPKGVMIRHEAAWNTIAAVNDVLKLDSTDRCLGVSEFSFDLSVYDIFGPLAAGACLVLPDAALSKDPAHWVDLVLKNGVTTWNSVPALFELFCDASKTHGPDSQPMPLRHALLSGDWIPLELANRARKLFPGLDLISLGGATEAAIWSVWYRIESELTPDARSVPYGKAMPGQRLFVLNGRGEVCPTWVPGDLYIDGFGLASGYIGDDQRTREAFVQLSSTSATAYRTGDRACLLPDGNLEFLGRRDRQVKINGRRIELGEIENVIAKHDSVARCVVVSSMSSHGRKIIAYAVPVPGCSLDDAELVDHMRNRLPDYMLPTCVVTLEELPLTQNGKVNTAALPLPEGSQEPVVTTGRSATLDLVISLFEDVLPDLTAHEETNLVSAGGSSLEAVRIVVRAREVFGVSIPLRAFLANPTVRVLAELAEAARRKIVSPDFDDQPIRLAERSFPLSPAQAALWTLYRLDPASTAYNTVDAFRFPPGVEPYRFRAAIEHVVTRHDSLRTIIEDTHDGSPLQRVTEIVAPIETVEIDDPRRLIQAVEAEGRRYASEPFVLNKSPPVKFTLFTCLGGDTVLLVAMHHIVCDGWSLEILIDDIQRSYDALETGVPLDPLPSVQFGDLTVWRQRRLEAVSGELARAWRSLLAGIPTGRALTQPKPAKVLGQIQLQGERRYFELPDDAAASISRTIRATSSSMYVIFMHLFARSLSLLTGWRDIVIGSPVADRYHPLCESLIGMFINTVPVRMRLFDEAPKQALDRAREEILDAMDLRELPYADIVRAANPPRHVGRDPPISAMFALQQGAGRSHRRSHLAQHLIPLKLASAKFDLTLEMRALDDDMGGFIEYRPEVMDGEFVERLLAVFKQLCLTIEDDVVGVTRWPLDSALIPGSRSNAPRLDIWSFILQKSFETPGATALETPEGIVTYAELLERASSIGRALNRRDVGKGDIVAICGQPTADVVVAALGVLCAGGTMTLIDSRQPPRRVDHMLESIKVALRIDTELKNDVTDARVVTLDALECAEPGEPFPDTRPSPDSLCYVAFTSGSTSIPNAIGISHAAIENRIRWGIETGAVTRDDRVLMITSISFDVSICEIFETLSAGATVVVEPHGSVPTGSDLLETVKRRAVSVVNLTPSLLREVCLAASSTGAPSLRRINCGGEPLTNDLKDHFFDLFPSSEFYNFYGLTECTVDTTIHQCKHGVPVRAGRPVADARILVVDNDLKPVRDGEVGEICVGGPGLAWGYLNNPEKTVACFRSGPEGQRVFRTGDMGRLDSAGELEVLGRRDDQIKIRGVRIEIGEIVDTLKLHQGVRDCAVTPYQTPNGEHALGALVVGEALVPKDIRAHLGDLLNDASIPTRIIELEALPLTPAGKFDRQTATELLSATFTEAHGRSAASSEEQRVCDMLEKLLGAPVQDPNADFFELGGHSLLAGRFAFLLSKEFGVHLTIKDIIESPTPAGLVRRMTSREATTPETVVRMRTGSGATVFLIHSLGGEVACYVHLAKHLGCDWNVIGLRFGHELPPSLEDLAETYAKVIIDQCIERPFHIVGWSAGGIIAHTVASLIETAGLEVGWVGLVDSSLTAFAQPMTRAGLLRAVAAEFGESESPSPVFAGGVDSIRPSVKVQRFLQRVGDNDIRKYLARAKRIDSLIRNFDPKKISAPLHLIASQDLPHDDISRWRGLTSSRLQLSRLPIDHWSLLHGSWAKEVAEIFDRYGT